MKRNYRFHTSKNKVVMNKEKADEIRKLYFTKRMKQWEIGELFGIGQPSVSRIISDQVWQ